MRRRRLRRWWRRIEGFADDLCCLAGYDGFLLVYEFDDVVLENNIGRGRNIQ